MELKMDSVFCRLCGFNSPDLVEIFDEQGIVADYARKIGRYLYLLIAPTDDLPKTLCRMCSQQLDTFHQFHEMIHEIQHQLLQERYSEYAIEVHQEYLEDQKIEIFEQLVKEENALNESVQPELQAKFPILGNDSHAAKQHDADDELIPNANDKESILMVKTEQAVEAHQSLRVHNVETAVPGVDVFKIRKSSRKKRTYEQRRNHAPRNQYDSRNDEAQVTMQQKTKTDKRLNIKSEDKIQKHSPKDSSLVFHDSTRKRTSDTSNVDITEDACDDQTDGESGDEYPAQDSDSEEWPAEETKDKFPTTILKNGLLAVKGKKLMEIINRFFTLHCDLCTEKQVRFETVHDLFGHYQTNHEQEGYVTCCQKKIYRFQSIIMHMARHIQPDAFKCDICGYLVTRPKFLEIHRQSHLPEAQKPYGCEHCPKRYCDERTYLRHLNIHKSPEDRMIYVCPICGKRYDSPGGLSKHKRNVHLIASNTRVPHYCKICAKTYVHAASLKEHIASCHQPRGKTQVQCTVCSKWLIHTRSLKVHMQLHRDEDVACDMCDYKTKKMSVLKRHIINKHQDEKPFSCEKCNSSFKHRQTLTAHMRVKHNDGGKTSFKCNFCDRSFKSANNFYTHRKNRHPEELAAMNEQAESQRKLQRIKAGIEPDDGSLEHETTISGKNDGISDPSGTMCVLDISKNQVIDKV